MATRSMDEALEDVGRVLVYDPETRQLCLRRSNPIERKFSENSADSGSFSTSSSSKDISGSCSLNEADIPDLDLSPSPPLKHLHSVPIKLPKKLLTNLIAKLSPNTKSNRPTLTIPDDTLTTVCLERRPSNLPPKSVEEEQRHTREFEAIVKCVKRREAEESNLKRRHQQQRLQAENEVSENISVWNNEILPAWPECLSWRRTKELWSAGIPGPIRSKLWTLAIGNELNITEEFYQISLARSKHTIWADCDPKELLDRIENLKTESVPLQPQSTTKESTAFFIKLDVSRTFAHLGLFQESGPYHQELVDILAAYAVCRPDLGYSQGMSFLAAMLLLNLDSTESAFIAFSNLINRDPFQSFYRLDKARMERIYERFESHLERSFPALASHFRSIQLKPEFYLVEQIYTLFSRSLPLEAACRIWDLYLRDGESVIFRASLTLMSIHHDQMLEMDFVDIAKLLTTTSDSFDNAKFFQRLRHTKLCTLK